MKRSALPLAALLLGLAAAVLALGWPWNACGLAVLTVVAGLARFGPRQRWWTIGALASTLVAVLVVAWQNGSLRMGEEAPEVVASRAYEEFWDRLRAVTQRGAQAIQVPIDEGASRLEAFASLESIAREFSTPNGQLGLLLLDADGEAVAWAGEGLLHEAPAHEWPRDGSLLRASFEAATFAWVRALENRTRPWRIVGGVSVTAGELPFLLPASLKDNRWRVVREEAGARHTVTAAEAPSLSFDPSDPASQQRALGRSVPRWSWLPLGLALLALSVSEGIRQAVLRKTVFARGTGWGPSWGVASLGLALVAFGCGAGAGTSLALGGSSLLLAWAGALRWHGQRDGPGWHAVLASIAALTVLVGLAVLEAGWRPNSPLIAQGLLAGAESFWGRVAWGSAAFAAFLLVSALSSRRAEGRWLVLTGFAAVGFATLAATQVDQPWRGIPLALVAAVAILALLRSWERGQTWKPAAALIASLLLASVASQTAHRLLDRQRIATAAARVGPPAEGERERLRSMIEAELAANSLHDLGPDMPSYLAVEDLAFALWRRSSLARQNARSALVVSLGDGRISTFAYGLPLDREVPAAFSPLWADLMLPGFAGAVIEGEATIPDGASNATARFWLLPEPGFAWGGALVDQVRVRLLSRGPYRDHGEVEGLPRDVAVVVYDPAGRPVRSPWAEPPARARVTGTTSAWVSTPAGWARRWEQIGDAYSVTLFRPRLGAFAALDRCGTQALTALAGLVVIALTVLLLGMPRSAVRDALRGTLRSYSRRLLLGVTALLFLPLVALDLVVTGAFEANAVRQRLSEGAESLRAAQRVLTQYLATLEPGFSLDAALDDALLRWLSGVVDRDLNLYWGSRLYTASQPELFGVAILPRRIPGEIFARVSILGEPIASRTNVAEGVAYRELYATLRGTGAPGARGPLVLSLPLIAQEAVTAAQADDFRRRGLLVTSALFLALLAMGAWLAARFTRPIRDLVEGTQRIAAGASELGVAPGSAELESLATAIDRMARRIADGRSQLLREKQTVEGVVENITAAVVSVSAEGRVVLSNRIARERLGLQPGESLRERWAAFAPWQPLLELLAEGAALGHRSFRTGSPGIDAGATGEREWTAIAVPLPPGGEATRLLVVEDSTELLRAQRLDAWAQMARIIAHEIKNPLTPIRLATEHLREVHARDPKRLDEVFDRCTSSILRQVEELREIASEFSVYSRIPEISLRTVDLADVVRATLDPYLAAQSRGDVLAMELPSAPMWVAADEALLRRALRNLIENALRASETRGGGVVVRLGSNEVPPGALIDVLDRGPGVAEEMLERIFEPYFSTHEHGTGLGLAIARRIAVAHGGALTARRRDGGGLAVRLTLPLVADGLAPEQPSRR